MLFLKIFREEPVRTKFLQVRENPSRLQVIAGVFVPFNTLYPPKKKRERKKDQNNSK